LNDIPSFVNRIPDNTYDSTYIKKGTLPIILDSIMFAAEPGLVYGPYLEENAYHMVRLMDRQSRPDSLKASHILIAYQGSARAEGNTRSKIQAQKTADSLFAEIKRNPERFEEIAAVINDDPTAKEKSGDLDWFVDGLMVHDFNEFCVKNKPGEMAVIETVFGYHIVKVTGKTESTPKIRLARVHINLEPSQDTYDDYWKQASKFVGEVRTIEDFDQTITRDGLNKRTASLETMTFDIPGLDNPREMVMWAFGEEVEKGAVSEKVFEFGNKYVIAAVREVRKKGVPTLEEVKADIEVLVRRDKKAEILTKQLTDAFAATKDFYAVAQKFNCNVDTLDFMRFDFSSVRGYGPEPYLIGKVFASTAKQMSPPIKGVQGVYVFITDTFTEATPTEDYSMMIMQLKSMFESRVDGEIYQALERAAKIEDNRILFY
jgi:peptidyl-prolyl cis-trans isomerase D